MKTEMVVDGTGKKWLIPNGDDRNRTLLESITSEWGARVMKSLRRILPKPDWVIDGGANVGQSAHVYTQWANGVWSYEADPEVLALAKKNVIAPNVFFHNLAVGDVNGCTQFAPNHQSSLGASIASKKQRRATIKIHQVRIDDHVRTTDQFDFIKLDLEGFELRALEGARQTIERCCPVCLVEIDFKFLRRFGTKPQGVVDFFCSLGYKIFTPSLRPLGKKFSVINRCRDRLFIHPETRAYKRLGTF